MVLPQKGGLRGRCTLRELTMHKVRSPEKREETRVEEQRAERERAESRDSIQFNSIHQFVSLFREQTKERTNEHSFIRRFADFGGSCGVWNVCGPVGLPGVAWAVGWLAAPMINTQQRRELCGGHKDNLLCSGFCITILCHFVAFSLDSFIH